MNLWTLALADLRRHRLSNSLHLLLMALGVALIAALLLLASQIAGRFTRDARDVDLVLGAKGSPLQLILSTVYHLDIPTGNIPLDEARRWGSNAMVASAIPLSLGDNVRGFRIVGTTPAMIERYDARLASGRVWKAPMEAVIGADVAQAGLKDGANFVGAHGLTAGGHAHADHPYHVVGVLAPTHTVLDRLVLTSLESVWEIHAAHHHHDDGDHDDDDDDDDEGAAGADGYQPRQEITALLLKYRTPLAAVSLPRMINMQSKLQAASPAFETARLMQLMGLGFATLKALAGVLIAAATLSVFIALYTAMEARQYDLAVLRSFGASRWKLVALLWLQAMLLSGAGALLGLALGHAAVEALGLLSPKASGIKLTGLTAAPDEAWLLVLPLLVGTLAALLPAWRAYRNDPAVTLAQAH
ncbi:FtsX-like permease family protein [Solimonas soli]|uniref:FtsX-like permease family protein n=1 Tax=Solimonas soli TaxID=413479 RepID=UPI0004885A4C|nr:FtsX-like permease family protein [Solimonas soli]